MFGRKPAHASFALVLTALAASFTPAWATDKQTIVYEFTDKANGSMPSGGLLADASGNFYGVTLDGGTTASGGKGAGAVYKLSPNLSGGWTETVLYTFTGTADGANPLGNLTFDAMGNLYGITVHGGVNQNGVVFQLSPNSSGGWNETTIHAFTSVPDGYFPQAGLVIDTQGNLYGTTLYGGTTAVNACAVFGCGIVFELSPTTGNGWIETIIYTFTGSSDGRWSAANLTFDTSGDLFGTTTRGGEYDNGTVFSLSPSSGGWTFNLIHTFTRTNGDGGGPWSGVVFDHAGNLYGTTIYASGTEPGTVYELSPTGTSQWQETILHTFMNGPDGGFPFAGVILDRWGNLYGTTRGNLTLPTAYKLNRSTGWTLVPLHNLSAETFSPLIQDAAGNLYGTTQTGGGRYGTGNGTVFELSTVQ